MSREPEPTLPSGSSERPGNLLHGVDWAVEANVATEVMSATGACLRQRRRRRMAWGGALVAVGLLGVAYYSVQRTTPPVGPAPIRAVVDMPDRQVLPDGSVVELKDGSRISIAFEPLVRRVDLIAGEAHFQVAKNKDRPFVVSIGNLEVRAVGTAFSIQRNEGSVEVLVTEGRVALDQRTVHPGEEGAQSEKAEAPTTIATLDAGHRATIGISGPSEEASAPAIESVSEREVSERLSWRIPRLEFTQTPLVEVVAMINQHGGARLSLGDHSLAGVRISGVLRADHIETLLRLLEAEDGIKAERRPGGEIVLSRGR